jgi:predicted acetyltransferase
VNRAEQFNAIRVGIVRMRLIHPYCSVLRLREPSRSAIRRHLDELGPEDRYLRFGNHPGEVVLDEYVANIDFEDSVIFGAIDEQRMLIGMAHLSRRGAERELGLSVVRTRRGHGIGASLLRRSLQHACQDGAERVLLHCLADNHAIISLAQGYGAKFDVSAGIAVGEFICRSVDCAMDIRGGRTAA